MLAAGKADRQAIEKALAALSRQGLVPETIGAHAGEVEIGGKTLKVNRAAGNAPSVIYDAVLVPAGAGEALAGESIAQRFLHEAWRHGKPIAVAEDAAAVLDAAGVPRDSEGLVMGSQARLVAGLLEAMKQHRYPRTSALHPA